MKIYLVTDSGSDITQAEAKAKGINVLPLKTVFGDEEFLDGITLTTDGFYEKLIESDTFPKTSQVTPDEYAQAFKSALETHDRVLCITLSSKLSGCYQSAVIAAEDFDGRVTVVDSENVTLGQRNLIDYALQMIDDGQNIEVIEAALNTFKKKIILVALLDTLEYLRKGGRISAVTAAAGALLSIKPVIAINEGEVKMLGKARGSKNGNNLLTQTVEKNGPIDYDKPYCLAYSGLSDHLLKKYVQDNIDLYTPEAHTLNIHRVGSTIGTHVGPGAIAVSFFVK